MTSSVTGSSAAVICVAHEIRRDVAACRGPLPPSLAGEGWGGGGKARILLRTPSLSLPRRRGGGRCGAAPTSRLSKPCSFASSCPPPDDQLPPGRGGPGGRPQH